MAARSTLADRLLAQRPAFRAFLRARVESAADADDLLQSAFLKALAHASQLSDPAKTAAWFYRLLRRSVIDHQRSRTTARKREESWSRSQLDLAPASADGRQPCRCVQPLLRTLKPLHARLLEDVELNQTSVVSTAERLHITPNHASVTLHRARTELRKKLQARCGPCANTHCRDCDCT